MAEEVEADAAASDDVKLIILTCFLSDAAQERLFESGDYELIDDEQRVADADLVAVSTRIPKGRSVSVVEDFREATDKPIIAVTHAGGEQMAVQMLAMGATALVAEGNEEALGSYASNESYDERLVDTFERSQEREGAEPDDEGLDPVTSLPGPVAFEETLAALSQAAHLPRVGFVRLPGYAHAASRLSHDAAELMRRRIAAQLAELCRQVGGELFTLGESDFAVVAASLSLHEFDDLGERMADATASFTVGGSNPLALAMGHAGPEVTSEVATLTDLAHRALELAVNSRGASQVVSAEKLSRMLASSTEFEAARHVLEFVEARDGSPGHGDRVAAITASLVRALGIDGRDALRIRLAAYLHHIGKVSLPEDADGDAHQSHCENGERLVRTSAGQDVAAIVRSHHERWDGSGFPDGLEGEAIPFGARIVAVADALEKQGAGALPTHDTLKSLEDASGTEFDPDVVKAALSAFG